MTNTTRISIVVLAVAAFGILALVMREALSGPTFRAADHATYEECILAIPSEWLLGSLERSGAEAACHYETERRRQRGR
jgi:hypothetical protein